MIITCDNVSRIQDLMHFLGQYFEIKDRIYLSYFLSLEVSSSNSYYLTQDKYTSNLISQASITNSKIVNTPIEYSSHLNTYDGEPFPDATLYRQLIRSLIYLIVIQVNISYAVHIVSQFMLAPQSPHYVDVLRILRYLKGKLFHGLHFSFQSSLTLQTFFMQTGSGTLQTIICPHGIAFFFVTPSSLGTTRNKLLLLILVLRQNI